MTFKEQYDLFKSPGCTIVGIGPGSYEKLKDFKSTIGIYRSHYSDVDRAVGESYNIPMHLGQFPTKSSFVIGPDNKVKYVYDWLFRPRRHVGRFLERFPRFPEDRCGKNYLLTQASTNGRSGQSALGSNPKMKASELAKEIEQLD